MAALTIKALSIAETLDLYLVYSTYLAVLRKCYR
jgi:hypothetical protein